MSNVYTAGGKVPMSGGGAVSAPGGGGSSPTWFTGITSGQWGTLPNSNIVSAGVLQTDDTGQSGSLVIDDWGSAVICTGGLYVGSTFTAGTWLVVIGGGHTDYGGNEVYAYGPFENNSPTWNRPRDQTRPNLDNVNHDGAGNPVSCHTYSSLVYLPNQNYMMRCAGGARHTDTNGSPFSDFYDFGQVSPNVNQPWKTALAFPGAIGSPTFAYNSVDGKIWGIGNPSGTGQITVYDPAGNSWSNVNFKSPTVTGDTSAEIEPTKNTLVIYGYNAGISLNGWDCSTTSGDYYTPTQTGTGPTDHGSIIYDPVLAKLVVWAGGQTLHTLTLPSVPASGTWTWGSIAGGGVTPPATQVNGTYNRFRYVPGSTIRGYVLLNSANDNIYFYRP